MAKPRFESFHHSVIELWFIALVGFVWFFLWINHGSGWLEELVVPLAIYFFIAGAVVIAVATGVARFLLSGRYSRLGVLIGIPGLVVIWLIGWFG